MPRLPDVIDPRTFPIAELSALRLDGELFPLAQGLVLADALDTPVVRAQAALAGYSRRLIAELDTAAWIWGALPVPPLRPEFCADIGQRARLPPGLRIGAREVVHRPADVAVVGGVQVTTPLRTAIDLARLRGTDYDADLVRRLLIPGNEARALAILEERKRLPNRERARARIAALPPPEPPAA